MKYLMIIVAVMISGCTSMDVKPIPATANVKHVCIEDNKKVKVEDFLGVVRDSLLKHGITSDLIDVDNDKYSNIKPIDMGDKCDTRMRYTALRSWDFTTYLSHAEIRIFQDEDAVGEAIFHLRGKGGLSLMKFEGTEYKIKPLMELLLENY